MGLDLSTISASISTIAMFQGGLWGAFVGTIFLGLISAYTVDLLIRCEHMAWANLDADERLKRFAERRRLTYPELARLAFPTLACKIRCPACCSRGTARGGIATNSEPFTLSPALSDQQRSPLLGGNSREEPLDRPSSRTRLLATSARATSALSLTSPPLARAQSPIPASGFTPTRSPMFGRLVSPQLQPSPVSAAKYAAIPIPRARPQRRADSGFSCNGVEFVVYLGVCLTSIGVCGAYVDFIASVFPQVVNGLSTETTVFILAPLVFCLAMVSHSRCVNDSNQVDRC